jgi:murein DD-endopeptidase MepM/ murein hydrolase activator NlpD
MRRSFAIAFSLALLLAATPAAHARDLGSRLLRVGSHGDDVVQLQRALHALGYGLVADGDYGAKTARTVKRYERKHHLRVDGVVSAREARRILRASSGGSPAEPPSGGQSPTPQPDDTPPSQPPPSHSGDHVFPVQGSYSYGGAGARFGAPRGNHTHQGQDVFAAEGTPVVSVSAGTVYWRAYQASAAGNYVVIRGSDGFDYVYMHFREGALVGAGDHVDAGEPIGHVGETGDAEGPHLHFEIWDGGHWQDGGHPIDPLPSLQAWSSGR